MFAASFPLLAAVFSSVTAEEEFLPLPPLLRGDSFFSAASSSELDIEESVWDMTAAAATVLSVNLADFLPLEGGAAAAFALPLISLLLPRDFL
jgi:hypothetical protein